MKDTFITKPRGHFLFECFDKDGILIDKFENNNLIMDTARIAMSSNIGGFSTSVPINKLVLGVDGNIPGDYLTPKTALEGFVSTRTELFSEENSTYTYSIQFADPDPVTGICSSIIESGTGSTVKIINTGSTVQYTFEIPETTANNSSVVTYTEAGLYSGGNIFSMKCFPAKIKDETVSLRIVWTILF